MLKETCPQQEMIDEVVGTQKEERGGLEQCVEMVLG